MEQEEKLRDKVGTGREFTCIGDRMRAGGTCEAVVTTRTRCGWAMFMKCGRFLCGRFPLKLKEAVYKSYIGPAILYGSEAWCPKESKMGILQRTERSMLREICGVQLKDLRMLMLG